MPTFAYRASDSQGRVAEGVLDAETRVAALRELQQRQLVPLRLAETTAKGRRGWRVGQRDVLAFTQQMAGLLSSGTPMDRALAILVDLLEDRPMGRIVSQLRHDVQSGASFSDALARHRWLFGPYFLNMVKAGEAGGVLSLILGRLAQVIEQEQEIRGRVRSSLVYPAFLLVFTAGAITVLMLKVVPTFETIFAGSKVELPLITRFVIGSSRFLVHYWWLVLGVSAMIVAGVTRYWQTPEGRLRRDEMSLRLPLIGSLSLRLQTARMARTFGTMLQSGVPLIQALGILQLTAGNTVLSGALERSVRGIREGGSVAANLKAQGVFPALAVHMIGVGEETGRLEEMLDNVARTFDSEVQSSLRSLLALLEPLMIVILTLVVGVVILSILLPLITMGNIVQP